jgi:hypothetical protein
MQQWYRLVIEVTTGYKTVIFFINVSNRKKIKAAVSVEQGHKTLTTSGKRQIMLKVVEKYGAGRVTVSGGKKRYGVCHSV